MRKSPSAFLFLASSVLALPVLAAGAAEPASSDPLEPVIVTASREPEPASAALASTIVIDRATIERSPGADLGDLMRFNAGIDVVRSGGPGQQTSLFVRGTNSNHTLVLIDGVRLNPGTLGVASLQNIPPDFVDHIEIVKGPRSALYGTDAIGGVVNIITRQPTASGFDVEAGSGRYATRQASAGAQAVGEQGSLSAAASWQQSDGYPTQVGDDADRGFRDVSLAVAARTRIDGLELGARVFGARGNTQYSDLFNSVIGRDQDFRNSAVAVDAGGQLAERLRSRVVLAQMTDDLRQNQIADFESSRDYETTRRLTLDWQNDADLGAQQLTFGAILMRENTRSSVFDTAYDVDTHAETGYVEDRATLGPHHLMGAVGYTHHETFGGHTTWNAEYGYALAPGALVTAAVGTAFRAPDSTDRYGFAGNPALKPESSRNFELGYRQRLDAHQVLSLAAFDNRVTDLIQYVSMPTTQDPFAGSNENVAEARIRGLEAAWEYADADWRTRLAASRQDPENRTTGTTLLRRAKASASLSVARLLGRQQLGFDALVSGPRTDVDAFGGPAHDGGYTLVNLFWQARLGGGLTLSARLENAGDKRYEVANGYFTTRRGLYGALRYDFR
ncbi:MAG: TonB-dependent receptor [Proteobacteria bacterium]|nr:TonB-dependent receptor [Pseudomonadota bacterium]